MELGINIWFWIFRACILILCIFKTLQFSSGSNLQQKYKSNPMQRKGLKTRIVGGEAVAPHEFPFLLSFREKGVVACGASIINEHYALTAAHCTAGLKASDLSLVAGEHNIEETSGDEVTIGVSEVIEHPNYDEQTHNDISVLKFNRTLKFNEFIQPISMVNPNYKAKGTIVVTGWGQTEEDGLASKVLLKTSVQVSDHLMCRRWWDELFDGYYVILKTQFCAYNEEGGKDTCHGDSGGPAFFHNGYQFYLVGIVSYGYGCGKPGKPGIYTDVAKFRNWVYSVIKH